jgi:hypothetical protein
MSAVDYLFEQLWELPKDKLTWYAVLKEAKEIEKKQIVNAHGVKKDYSYSQIDPLLITGEEYYNKNFNKE